jgi:hypothetical protein
LASGAVWASETIAAKMQEIVRMTVIRERDGRRMW